MSQKVRVRSKLVSLRRANYLIYSTVLHLLVNIYREFKLHVLTANGKRQNGADSAYVFCNE